MAVVVASSAPLPLDGQAAVVTGGSSGIGRAIALALAAAGADVAITYHVNEAGAREVERGIVAQGRRAVALRMDLAVPADIERAGREAVDALGPLRVWVNNAGADILTGPAGAGSDLEKLDRLLAVDLRGTVLASWVAVECLGHSGEGGTIINMSWDRVLSGMAGTHPQMFAAVKGGVLAFSKALARSVAPRIRVNVLAPGWIATAFADGLEAGRYDAVAASVPLGRWGTGEDVASAAVYLASPAAAFVTGQAILVGGGDVM